MKLEDSRGIYDARSTKASDVARQLAFAGLAVIWIFKTDKAGSFIVPHELGTPAFLMIMTLALDMMQYLCASALWGAYNRWKERTIAAKRENLRADKKTVGDDGEKLDDSWDSKQEFTAPPIINWPALFFFWLKLAVVIVGYAFLIRFLAASIGH